MPTVTNNVYDQYGEVHGGSVGETMCGANEICKGPNPDRIMEGNSYFGMGDPPFIGALWDSPTTLVQLYCVS
jgi:hypothetical protein